MAHLFICPNCGNRTSQTERTAGFRNVPKGCSKCGFGFLFELMDDYFPSPLAGVFVCGQDGRIIAFGKGAGAGSRASMAVTILGGQVLCLLLTLLVTPVVYSYFDDLREWSPMASVKRLLGRTPKTPTPAAERL